MSEPITELRSVTCHGITQCYLPPDRGERVPIYVRPRGLVRGQFLSRLLWQIKKLYRTYNHVPWRQVLETATLQHRRDTWSSYMDYNSCVYSDDQ